MNQGKEFFENLKKNTEVKTHELLGGKKDNAKIKTLANAIPITIKAEMSQFSIDKIYSDVMKLKQYLNKDTVFLIVKLFLQLGQPKETERILESNNTNDCYIYIQPKIKNYIEFKSIDSADSYKSDNIEKDELYISFFVDNGEIIIPE